MNNLYSTVHIHSLIHLPAHVLESTWKYFNLQNSFLSRTDPTKNLHTLLHRILASSTTLAHHFPQHAHQLCSSKKKENTSPSPPTTVELHTVYPSRGMVPRAGTLPETPADRRKPPPTAAVAPPPHPTAEQLRSGLVLSSVQSFRTRPTSCLEDWAWAWAACSACSQWRVRGEGR